VHLLDDLGQVVVPAPQDEGQVFLGTAVETTEVWQQEQQILFRHLAAVVAAAVVVDEQVLLQVVEVVVLVPEVAQVDIQVQTHEMPVCLVLHHLDRAVAHLDLARQQHQLVLEAEVQPLLKVLVLHQKVQVDGLRQVNL
jgi:hypothetical protein